MTNLAPVANGAGGTPDADSKTPEEILGDVNEVIQSAWEQSAYTSAPETLLISPRLFTSLNRRHSISRSIMVSNRQQLYTIFSSLHHYMMRRHFDFSTRGKQGMDMKISDNGFHFTFLIPSS